MEGYNSGLKRCQTYREMLPLGAFNTELFSSLKEKSEKYSTKEITKSISIEKDLWTKALVFNATNIHSVTRAVNIKKTLCYIPSKKSIEKNITPTSASINSFEKMEALTFDEFMDLMFSMWKLEFDHSDWESSICSCPQWNKSGICKHLVGIAITQNLLQPPANVNPAKLKTQTKRMPRRNAVKALTRQPNYDHAEPSLPSTSAESASNHQHNSQPSLSQLQSLSPFESSEIGRIPHQIDVAALTRQPNDHAEPSQPSTCTEIANSELDISQPSYSPLQSISPVDSCPPPGEIRRKPVRRTVRRSKSATEIASKHTGKKCAERDMPKVETINIFINLLPLIVCGFCFHFQAAKRTLRRSKSVTSIAVSPHLPKPSRSAKQVDLKNKKGVEVDVSKV